MIMIAKMATVGMATKNTPVLTVTARTTMKIIIINDTYSCQYHLDNGIIKS